jgi:transcriptional regulator with XRE-family HTH domain
MGDAIRDKGAVPMMETTIGHALRARRQELGLDQREVASLIGMSRTTYSSYERDAQRPSVDIFPAIAEFLAIPMEELLALYGATCIASVRPPLERLLGTLNQEATIASMPSIIGRVSSGLPAEATAAALVPPSFERATNAPNNGTYESSVSIFANELSADPYAAPSCVSSCDIGEESKPLRTREAETKKKKKKIKKRK